MDRHRGIRTGLEARCPRGLDAVPPGEMAMVRRPRLHLDRRGELGLAAISLWPLDVATDSGLDLGARRAQRIPSRRRVLDARSEPAGLGSACAWRVVERRGNTHALPE